MNLSKSMAALILIGSILSLVCAREGSAFDKAPARHKRWTFNTWRLHGRRQLSAMPSADPYAMGASSSLLLADQPYPSFASNEGDDAETIGERLVRVLQALRHKQQENNERDNRF